NELVVVGHNADDQVQIVLPDLLLQEVIGADHDLKCNLGRMLQDQIANKRQQIVRCNRAATDAYLADGADDEAFHVVHISIIGFADFSGTQIEFFSHGRQFQAAALSAEQGCVQFAFQPLNTLGQC